MDEGSNYRKEKEQFSAIAWGFTQSGVFAQLSGSASKVLIAIASLTNKYRNTSVVNNTLSRWAGINSSTVKNSLRELEYYQFIKRISLPGGSCAHRKRMIVLQRWDTAREKLIKENKINVDKEEKVIHVRPNPFRK